MSMWTRLESMARSISLEGGLEAQVADPLWMLSRQWQMSEFRGDDAAQPAAVRVTGKNVPLTGLRSHAGISIPLPQTIPLEALVEVAPGPDFGAAGMHAAIRASRRLMRLLNLAGLVKGVDALRTGFPLHLPDRQVSFGNAGTQTAALFARWGIDAAALARAKPDVIKKALGKLLTPAEVTSALVIITEWSTWYRGRDGETRSPAWDEERLEYDFTLTAKIGSTKIPASVELHAPDHTGGHLDWYSFDMASTTPAAVTSQPRTLTALPNPVRYQGMPAGRWWQFEDGTVNFGDLEAGPTDLARLVVAEFATIYSRDWFVVPIKVPVGSLTQITEFEVIDNFNERSILQSTAMSDSQKKVSRVWRMFELSGDEVSQAHPAPWLLVAPTLVNDVNGPVLERVLLTRDEGANLVWGIESIVEGLLGRSVERSQAWYAALPVLEQPAEQDQAASPLAYPDQSWRYQLESSPPAWWIPFLPERIADGSPEIHFRRARMQAWQLYSDGRVAGQIGPQGVFLDPRRACWINEEEVPRGGVRIERRWQFGRWSDGSYHIWLQRRKIPGRRERSSGLRWDLLKPASGENTL